MKATKHDSPAALFITLYKKVLSFESVVEIVKSEHSNESYWAVHVRSYRIVYNAVQGGFNFCVCGLNS